MPPMRLYSAAGLVASLALGVAACSSAAPTGQPSDASPLRSPAPSASVVAADPAPSGPPSTTSSPVPSQAAPTTPEPPTPAPTAGTPVNPTAKPIPAAPADCGTGEAGFAAAGPEVPADLRFGGATIEFTTAAVGLRDGSYTIDDAIPGGVGLSPNEIAVRVDPETHVILRGAGLTLTRLDARTVSWTSVRFDGGLGSSGEAPDTLAWRFRSDGSISVSAPAAPGDYMVSFGVDWFSHCLKGDGTAYGRIKVNG